MGRGWLRITPLDISKGLILLMYWNGIGPMLRRWYAQGYWIPKVLGTRSGYKRICTVSFFLLNLFVTDVL